jgi:type II secretory pathway pseudopilin PulG
LFVVAFIGVGLGVVGQVWSIAARRSAEQELLFIGDSFRRAIGSYYAAGQQFPQSLEELVLDERQTPVVHHLRKIYADPITHSTDWRLITHDDGAIVGVASQSEGRPLKVANFEDEDATFDGAECYCEWEFVSLPPTQRGFRTIVPDLSQIRVR